LKDNILNGLRNGQGKEYDNGKIIFKNTIFPFVLDFGQLPYKKKLFNRNNMKD